jgi:esterase/lipase superfamily enzyme
MSTAGVDDPNPKDYAPQGSSPSNAPPSAFLDAIVAQLSQQQSPPQLTVFVHGLATVWTDAINGAATLGANLAKVGYPGLVIGFDWPSYSALTSLAYYASGYRDAAISGTIRDNINGSVGSFQAMLAFVNTLRASVSGLKVSLVAHSEGNFMAMLGAPPAGSGVVFDQTLLLAADINDAAFFAEGDAYAGQGAALAALSGLVTVYYTRNDNTLAGSQAGFQSLGYHNPAYGGRLGQTGPDFNGGAQLSNLVSVDCSAVLNPLMLKSDPEVPPSVSLHSSYFYVTQVLQDLAATLAGVAPAQVANRAAKANTNDYLMTPAS